MSVEAPQAWDREEVCMLHHDLVLQLQLVEVRKPKPLGSKNCNRKSQLKEVRSSQGTSLKV